MKIRWYRFLVRFYYFIGKPSKAGFYLGKICLLGFTEGIKSLTGFMSGFNL